MTTPETSSDRSVFACRVRANFHRNPNVARHTRPVTARQRLVHAVLALVRARPKAGGLMRRAHTPPTRLSPRRAHTPPTRKVPRAVVLRNTSGPRRPKAPRRAALNPRNPPATRNRSTRRLVSPLPLPSPSPFPSLAPSALVCRPLRLASGSGCKLDACGTPSSRVPRSRALGRTPVFP